MPVYITDEFGVATLQDQANWGNKVIAEIYWGSTLKYKAEQNYTLNSAQNVTLETFLTGQGASVASPVIITIPAGQIIGSLDNLLPALTTGDLSLYTRGVTLIINGEVQGAGGTNTGQIEDRPGGVAFEAMANITITNNGAIRGGGGAGGQGGNGGAGNDILTSWSNWRYDRDRDRFCTRHPDDNDLTGDESEWNNNDLGQGNRPEPNTNYIIFSTGTGSAYTYERGDFEQVHGGAKKHEIRRASGYPTPGTIGFGGLGGDGEGYTQAKTSGADGSAGTNRAGNGGMGGDGGNWGQDGATGDPGSAGMFYDVLGPNQTNPGVLGANGAVAGNAIQSNAYTVNVTGPGVINGPVA